MLAESLGYKEESSDCTVPCTPPRSEEDIYNSLDTDFFAKKEESNPLLKEILFKEETIPANKLSCLLNCLSTAPNVSSLSPPVQTTTLLSPASVASPTRSDLEKSPLRELLYKGSDKISDPVSIKIEDATDPAKSPLQKEEERKSDHQLLREVLRDTSFQKKYNLRPVDLGAVGTGFVEDMEPGESVGEFAREQIEPVLSLAIQQLQKDFDNTCVALGIHPGKNQDWSKKLKIKTFAK